MHWITAPWPWYVAGPLIALIMFLLLYMGKSFGFSSNLRTLCTLCGAGKTASFFRFDWRKQRWNLLFLVGSVFGGFIASHYLSDHQVPALQAETVKQLQQSGFESAGTQYMPTELYSEQALSQPKNIIILLIAGLLIGFGTRYAGGCTSGHAISGISNLQIPSMLATAGFFIGGLIMIHLLFPFIFG
ncbi:YeeE/YedE family protein [Sphingobacterium sp. LRF_L2]|uniref:YeeE/YedE family protein n=1 Tax=Sphingobacterium sp. LRF_L2 TaxID=3369421 RepID=UPI003F5F07FF